MPSPNFVGREAELAKLDQILRSHPGVVVSAIAGMGGLGKTELAVQYATHHLADYPGGICWLNGRIGDLGAQVVQIVTREFDLELPQKWQGRPITAAEQVAWCWEQWVPAGAVLVVLDDVATWDTFAPIFPQSPRFRILMTTREQDLARQFPVIALDVLPLPKAVELLKKLERCDRVSRDRSAAETLCELVGRLPLGIELVGRYLASDRFLTLSEMDTRLRQKGLQDPAFEKVPNAQMTAQLGVKAAFELSWERLAPEAQRVARLLGYFALDAIPWAIAEQMMQVSEGEAYTIRAVQTILDNMSLVQAEEESLEVCSLHPLIQQFVREKESEWIQESSDRSLQDAFLSEMVAIARQIPFNPISADIRKVKWARSHLEEAAEHWKEGLEGDDLLQAFEGIAQFYKGQGLYAQAESWYKHCLTATTVRCEGDHPTVAESLNDLALLYQAQGRLGEAEALYLQSLEMKQRLFEGDHLDVASALNNLAALYRAQGRLSEVEALYLQSLEMKQRLFEGDHSEVIP
jgi:tetratricopeptide (TPR) repeat protein